jgi:hypothetical protein
MFAAAARAGPVKSTAPKAVTRDSAAADALLEDILGDIAPDAGERARHGAPASASASAYTRPAPSLSAAAAAAHPVFSRGELAG